MARDVANLEEKIMVWLLARRRLASNQTMIKNHLGLAMIVV